MRQVYFKKWIPIAHESKDGKRVAVPGTGCFEPEFSNFGRFHQWASKYDEFESGPGNFTVGIIETQSGEIYEALPTNIKFLDRL